MAFIRNRVLVTQRFSRIAPLFLLGALLGSPLAAQAQQKDLGTIKGRVLDDSTGQSLEFVTVALRNTVDTTATVVGITDHSGTFNFVDVSAGVYSITLQLIGYAEHKTPTFVIDLQHRHLNAGKIMLTPRAVHLPGIAVMGEKPLYSTSIDRKVYAVTKDIMSRAGSASEVLQNVPSVQVDIDGNVSLRGSSSVLIMIDGKASPLMKLNSATALQQMPASSIERVEVITNPSAKYTPEGTSGIINIVLNKNSRLGLNGSIAANGALQDRYNSTLRLNYNPGDFNAYASYSIRKDSRNRVNDDSRSETDSTLTRTYYNEHLTSRSRPLSHLVSGGFDYRLGGGNQLGASGDFFHNGFTRNDVSDQLLQDSNHLATEQLQRDRLDYESEAEYKLGGFVEHDFPKEDHTLRLEFEASGAPETEDNHYTNHYSTPQQPDSYDNSLIKTTENSDLLTLDYSNPLSDDAQLEAGYAGEFNRIDNDFRVEYFDTTQQQFIVDPTKTNQFQHSENIQALYATYKRTFGSFGALAGLRGEYATVKSNLVTLDSVISNSYSNLYPSVHLSYKLSKASELQASYSRRTRRPESDDLNPFREYRDARNVRVGNPRLLPEYVHSLELGYQFQNNQESIVPALFYRYTYNRFTSVTQVIADTSITTEANLASDQSGGVEVVASTHVGKWMDAQLNANAFVEQIDASNLGYSSKKSATTWSSTLILDLIPGPTSRIQINSNYRSSRLTPQGKYSPSYTLNLGFRRNWFDDKLSLTITVADVLKTMKRELVLNTPALNETVVNRRDSRIVYLGLAYYFGAPSKKGKEEQMQYDNNQ